MAAFEAAPIDASFDVDKLSYEIFSILEAKFLFGYEDPKLILPSTAAETLKSATNSTGKVRILSIDSGGSTDGILSAKSLSLLESSLSRRSGNPDARIADFFDIAAGAGAGGVLASLLFTRGEDGRPLFTAGEAMKFLLENLCRVSSPSRKGRFRRIFRLRDSKSERIYRKTFSEYTLKDTLKPVLIPCYDLLTEAPFLFSRADALETDGYDFKMREVCSATCADPTAVEMRSVDGQTKIVAVDGCVAMSNPTAAAITHVLNNKQEFPFCRGVEDLLVVSLGNGGSDSGMYSRRNMMPCVGEFVRIAGDGVSDMVDQAVSMAFGDSRTCNYVRIQANGMNGGGRSPVISKSSNLSETQRVAAVAEEMLMQKNVESMLFRGKKIDEKTNADKLDWFAGELIKEKERRKLSIFPTVVFKQATPRTSSATISSC